MKEEPKIFLGRTDGLDAAVDKILHTRGAGVTINIPKNSALGSSVSNFQVLKRESLTAGKKLTIESVDDRVLELASLAKITASNPVFMRTQEKPSMDIVRRAPKPERKSAKLEKEVRVNDEGSETDEAVSLCIDTKAFPEAHERISFERKPSRIRRIILLSVIFLSIAGAAWGAYTQLPRATVTLEVKRREVPVNESVEISKKYGEVSSSAGNLLIPGELFVQKGNLLMDFPASGVAKVNNKANGTITIYNAYSSAPQQLVALTRFETPDGKIFKLDKQITVPGAKIVNGKIEPSSIDATVTASEAGEAYNIGPVSKWTIPGFKSTPRFAGFYGVSALGMAGGVVGERSVPSAEDKTNGEKKVEDALHASLEKLLIAMAGPYTALPGSTRFVITTDNVQLGGKDEGKFGVYMEGEIRKIVFDETTLKNAIVAKIQGSNTKGEKVADMALQYGGPTYDFQEGTIDMRATGTVTFAADIDTDTLKTNLLGADESSARNSLSELQGLNNGTLELWPFWVHSIPSDPAKLTVVIK